jgi:hypothetical protein
LRFKGKVKEKLLAAKVAKNTQRDEEKRRCGASLRWTGEGAYPYMACAEWSVSGTH